MGKNWHAIEVTKLNQNEKTHSQCGQFSITQTALKSIAFRAFELLLPSVFIQIATLPIQEPQRIIVGILQWHKYDHRSQRHWENQHFGCGSLLGQRKELFQRHRQSNHTTSANLFHHQRKIRRRNAGGNFSSI